MRLFKARQIITGRPGEVLRDAAVLVDGQTFRWVGALAALPAGSAAEAEVTDYGQGTLLPGLIDSHVHLAFDGGAAPVQSMRNSTDNELLVLMLHSARQLLAAGVTTARDLGARAFLDVEVRKAIDAGLSEGPRMLVANRPVTVTGGHCWFMGCECDSLEAIRAAVRLHHRQGADLIKVMATGGNMTPGSAPWNAQFGLEELQTIVHEAHRLAKKVAAHAHGTPGISLAVAAGVDTIEHCSWQAEDGERKYDQAVAERIAAAGIFVCPTTNWKAQGNPRWEQRAATLAHMREAGIRLIAGTDAGIGTTPHREYVGGLEALAATGMSALEVLEAATSRAATALGVGGVTGTIASGKEADLLALDGDPLQDLGTLRTLRLVMTRGRASYESPSSPGRQGRAVAV